MENIENTPSVAKTTSLLHYLNRRNIIIVAGVGFALITIAVLVLVFLPKPNSVITETAPIDSAPGPKSGSYPEGICPDEIIYGSGAPIGIWAGQEYVVNVDDIAWLDANCKKDNTETLIPSSDAKVQGKIFNQECTDQQTTEFTSRFADYNSMKYIIPPGVAAGEYIKSHSYIGIKGEEISLYAPTDMYLVQGAYYKENPTFVAKTTYILHFLVGCDIVLNYDHITNPVDKIKNVLNSTAQDGTGMESFLSEPIFIAAGEFIGTTIGAGSADMVRTFDFGVYDKNHTNQYVNQARYEKNIDWKSLNSVCGYSYFAEPLKSQYYALFSNHAGKIVPDAPCRGASQDKEGTLAGAWHKNKDDDSVFHKVAIAIDLDNKTLNITGIGDQFFRIEDSTPTFIDPAKVTTEHCFEDRPSNIYVYAKLLNSMEMRAYQHTGRCPAAFDDSKALTYYR